MGRELRGGSSFAGKGRLKLYFHMPVWEGMGYEASRVTARVGQIGISCYTV